MSQIKVALVWQAEPWRGGVNYYLNLCRAVARKNEAKVSLILFTGMGVNTYNLGDYVEIVHTPLLQRRTPSWFVWKVLQKVLRRDFLLYLLMKKHRIDIISHYGSLWKGCPIPSVQWVPDFQFLRLPDMFRVKDVKPRVRELKRICEVENDIFVSSMDAKHDMEAFANGRCPRIHVLPFASTSDEHDVLASKQQLMARFGLPEHWIYLPNQFWKHKNHQVVIDSLAELKHRREMVAVVATGSKSDFRNSGHFQSLNDQVKKEGLDKYFIVLGEVPYADVLGLMEHSIAVVNPSLFEGWSTTVEEAKAMGKMVILSDIPVHREQLPHRALYFSPFDSIDLARLFIQVLKDYSPEREEDEMAQAREYYNTCVEAFAHRYLKSIRAILAGDH